MTPVRMKLILIKSFKAVYSSYKAVYPGYKAVYSSYPARLKAVYSGYKAVSVAALLLCNLMLLGTPSWAALPAVIDNQQPMPSLAPVLLRVQASMVKLDVEVNAAKRGVDPFFKDPFFRRFFDRNRASAQRRNKSVTGTGMIIDAEQGLIITNERKVDDAKKILVTLSDGRQVEATLLGRDNISDVAVLRIEANNLVAAPIAAANTLSVGDFVISVSHVLGAQGTFTSGIVSGIPKTGYSTQNFQSYIQTDASVGSGLLINLRGELVGLNISKVAQTEGGARIGFSTPMEVATKVVAQVLEYGAIQRGYLAIQVQNVSRDLAEAFDIKQSGGAVITNVVAGSSAAQAGMQVGDIIVKADEHVINHGIDLRNVIGSQFSGDPIKLTVIRDAQELILPAVLESSSPIARIDSMIHYQLEGATFSELNAPAALSGAGAVNRNLPGVMVSQVKPGSVAWDHGMREKDLVVSANRAPIKDLDSFRNAVSQKDVLMLNIMRDDRALFLLLK